MQGRERGEPWEVVGWMRLWRVKGRVVGGFSKENPNLLSYCPGDHWAEMKVLGRRWPLQV